MTGAILRGGGAVELLTVEQLASELNLTVRTVRRWREASPKQGPVARHVGGRIRFAREDVNAWLDAQAETDRD